jgi:hypothetical protein
MGVRSRLVVFLCFLFSGCAEIPPLVDDGITISEIVQRVKCEIWYATPLPQGKYPTGPYQWMRDWTAKVDLTLETDDTGSVTPGASFITPMHSVTLPGFGSFSRLFSFGVGGGLNTTASRTETLSFTLSLAELRNPQYRDTCTSPEGLGLLGNLGLNEWMQAALAPASGPKPELLQGYHAAPSSGAKAATPKGPTKPKAFGFDPIQEKIDKLNDTVATIAAYADEATSYAGSAQKLSKVLSKDDLTKSPQAFYGEVQQLADYAAMAQDAIDEANSAVASANAQITDLKKNADDARVNPAIKSAQDTIQNAKTTMTAASTAATAALGALPPNPPIDSISHQVSFIVSLSGNVTPSWTLVHFKGPGTGSTFAAASRSLTHTLNIAMGSPSDSGAGKVSLEQLRQLDYLHQEAAFRNALTLQSVPGQF